MKKVGILGSTGSIGRNALDVLERLENFKITFLSCHSNIKELASQVDKFKPELIGVIDPVEGENAREVFDIPVLIGFEEIEEALDLVDILLISTTGTGVINILLKALNKNIRIAMANKETLVAFSPILRDRIKGKEFIPVDSEHSAIFQSIHAGRREDVKRIILTASGGPFRNREDLSGITPEEALKHPNWNMGKKITVDSATLFNKGLEAHEAKAIFNLSADMIEIVIHPQSIIHSLVEFMDGSVIAQMSLPDMRIPIQFAFTYPERITSPVESLNLVDVGSLTFESPDFERFPLLKLALELLKEENTLPAVMSRADEIAVEAFLNGKIGFSDIYRVVSETVEAHKPVKIEDVEDVLQAEVWAAEYARRLIK